MQINIMVSKAVHLFDFGKAKTNDSVVSILNLFKTLYEILIFCHSEPYWHFLDAVEHRYRHCDHLTKFVVCIVWLWVDFNLSKVLNVWVNINDYFSSLKTVGFISFCKMYHYSEGISPQSNATRWGVCALHSTIGAERCMQNSTIRSKATQHHLTTAEVSGS